MQSDDICKIGGHINKPAAICVPTDIIWVD